MMGTSMTAKDSFGDIDSLLTIPLYISYYYFPILTMSEMLLHNPYNGKLLDWVKSVSNAKLLLSQIGRTNNNMQVSISCV